MTAFLVIAVSFALFCLVVLFWCACRLAGDADRRWEAFEDRPHDSTEADRLSVDEFIEAMGWVNEPEDRGAGNVGLVHDHLNIPGR